MKIERPHYLLFMEEENKHEEDHSHQIELPQPLKIHSFNIERQQ